jgi:hypothetical protein
VLGLADRNEQSSPLLGCDSSIVCSRHFPVRFPGSRCSMGNKITQEDEAVSPIPDGKLWKPGHVGVCK